MLSVELWIRRGPSQSLARKAYLVVRAEVSVLGVDIDTIGVDSLGVTAVLLLVFPGLWDHVLGLIMRIPADPVQESKAIAHRDTDLPRAEALWARAPNSTAALALPRTMGRTYL